MYQKMIERINEVVNSTPTNTGIFAASFDVLNSLLAEGLENTLLKPLFHEKRGMTSKANEKLVGTLRRVVKRAAPCFWVFKAAELRRV